MERDRDQNDPQRNTGSRGQGQESNRGQGGQGGQDQQGQGARQDDHGGNQGQGKKK